ncbi:MAG TPA: hypothetical protein VFY16_05650 [Gemmatimonadaceae bacterium]|nr:hypothetical protein [Gemmatimonadaceae bacterium]
MLAIDPPPGHQHAARAGHAEELREPVDHLLLHEGWRLVEAGHVRVEAGGEHVGHHAERRAVALHPTEEARMQVAVRVWQHAFREVRVRGLRRDAVERHPLGQRRAHLGRHRLPRGPRGERLEVRQHVVDHAVREGAERGPFVGRARVERRFGARIGGCDRGSGHGVFG